MKVHTNDEPGRKEQLTPPKSRSPLITILFILTVFVLGGFLTLLIVNRLLIDQSALYVSIDSMGAASAISDFMDDLLPLIMLCGSALLLLILLFATVWVWTKTKSGCLRTAVLFFLVAALALLLAMWLLGARTGSINLPTP